MQSEREREVAEVVGRKLQLPAFGSAQKRRGHHRSVVDQEVQRSRKTRDEIVDRLSIDEVEMSDVHLVVAR